MASLTTTPQMERFRLAKLRAAVKMEKAGMKHSSGRSATAAAKRELGLKRSAKHDEVIAALTQKMDEVFPLTGDIHGA